MPLIFAVANNPRYIIRGKTIISLNADKPAITAASDHHSLPFTNQTFDLQKGDCIYLFTDGYADQFGGVLGKKFMYKRFKDLFMAIHDNTMEEQKTILYTPFENWKGNLEQVDEVLVIGVKI